MNLLPTADQHQIIDAVAAFMAERLPVTRYRELAGEDAALSASQLQQIVDLGWLGLGLEEEHGGLGCSLVEEVLMFREIGRHVGPMSIYAAVLGARVAALAGQVELRDQLLTGELQIALALPVSADSIAGQILDGDFYLLGPAGATHAVLIDDHGAALFDTAGLVRSVLPCLEFHQTLAQVWVEQSPAAAYVGAEDERLIDRARLLAAAMQVGGAEASRDLGVEYAKQRQQFGRPIGSFQAIKHMCSDMAVRCEEAASQVFYASLRFRDGEEDANRECCSASYLASRAALENAAANVQIHGGMGMTAEVDVHHYLKRAHLLDQLMGSCIHQLDLLMADALQ